jgi:hypothetical protein
MSDNITYEQRRDGFEAVVFDAAVTLLRQLERAKDYQELMEIGARISKIPELLTPQ